MDRDEDEQYIIENIKWCVFAKRVQILQMTVEDIGEDKLTETADGTCVVMKHLSDDCVRNIKEKIMSQVPIDSDTDDE